MLLVGLTGGIGSGKSEAARRFAAHGAVVVDADVLAREVVAPGTPGLDAVLAAFGPQLRRADGTLDRERLGALVFADPDARRRLNAIVHPLVGAATAQRLAAIEAAQPDAIVLHDVPLLVEAGLAANYPVVVVVAAPESVQLARLTGQRGLSEEDARARIAAQAPLADKLAVATHVIDNDGSLEHLHREVDRVWAALVARAGEGE